MNASGFHLFRREPETSRERAEEWMRVATESGLAYYKSLALHLQGKWLVDAGQVGEGLNQAYQGLAALDAMGTGIGRSQLIDKLAERHANIGQVEIGLKLLDEALAWIERTGERSHEAVTLRIKGELLIKAEGRGRAAEAEACIHRAIEVARRQSAKSMELRAVMSLVKMQGGRGEISGKLKRRGRCWRRFTVGSPRGLIRRI